MIKFPKSVEFNFISSLISRAGKRAKGVGDDAAVLGEYLVSTDMSVENTHFRLDWESPAQAIEKCILSNLSDINAMGGRASLALFSFCLNKKWDWQAMQEITSTTARVCSEHNIKILGGDTTGGDCGVFSIVILGKKPKKTLYRSSAKVGDDIYITGYPGRSAAGLHILEKSLKTTSKDEKELLAIHKIPRPPLHLGAQLSKINGVNACIDLSDSLAESLELISLQSNVSLHIKQENIPLHKSVQNFCKKHKLNAEQFCINGGEDYELLFTATPAAKKSIENLAKKTPISCIGKVKKGTECFLQRANGTEELIEPNGWKHF